MSAHKIAPLIRNTTPTSRTRIKLTKKDSPAGHQDHHHFIELQLVGAVEGDIVKLSVNADALPKFEQEQSGNKV
jgi:hypothetical protein